MVTKEKIQEQVHKAKQDIISNEKRLKYWQSICQHDFKVSVGFCGGSEYDITRECRICGLYEHEN